MAAPRRDPFGLTGHSALVAGRPVRSLRLPGERIVNSFATDETGFRQYTLHVKDLETGELLPLRVEKTVTVTWAAGRTLFYTVEDAAKRSYRLYRHTLGEDAHDLVYEEQDERFSLGVTRSRSGAYVFLTSGSHTTTEVRFAPAERPDAEWRLIAPREQDHEYEAHHHGGHFYLRTNDRGRTFRVARAPIASPGREHWEEVVANRPEVMLDALDLFRGHAVLHELEGGLPHLRVVDLQTGEDHRVSFPEPAYALLPSDNAEFDTHVFRYNYQSLVTPASVYDYDMRARRSDLRKRVAVKGGYDPRDYALIAFGGAGPLHSNALSRLLGSWPSIIPPGPGVLCALGDATTAVRDERAPGDQDAGLVTTASSNDPHFAHAVAVTSTGRILVAGEPVPPAQVTPAAYTAGRGEVGRGVVAGAVGLADDERLRLEPRVLRMEDHECALAGDGQRRLGGDP